MVAITLDEILLRDLPYHRTTAETMTMVTAVPVSVLPIPVLDKLPIPIDRLVLVLCKLRLDCINLMEQPPLDRVRPMCRAPALQPVCPKHNHPAVATIVTTILNNRNSYRWNHRYHPWCNGV